MWRDIQRLCEKYGIAFKKPSQFPRNGLLSARVACIAALERWCPEFTRAVFHANFAEDLDISDPETIKHIIDSLGRDGTELIERSQAPENKLLLRKQYEEAVELGIFGAPSFVVGTELFWGNDRLEDTIQWYKERLQ